MKKIQIYDPAMCCSTGVCGTEVNPDLVSFAALMTELAKAGATVERFNLGQQPMAFAQNVAVKELLEKEGPDALPAIFVDGVLVFKGRYPSGIERPAFKRNVLG